MPEKPSTTRSGTVREIIKSFLPHEPEKAEISVEGADDLYKEIRIENRLVTESGTEISLKKGAEVEVTIEADPEDTKPRENTNPKQKP